MLVGMDRRNLEIAKKNRREAIARQERHEALGDLNRKLEAEFGPVDPELLKAVEREWFR